MKRTFSLFLLLFLNTVLIAQKIMKAELQFNGAQVKEGNCSLKFTDRKGKIYLFNARRSNTSPYIFYTTGPDGSCLENEKIRGGWFRVKFSVSSESTTSERTILAVEEIKN